MESAKQMRKKQFWAIFGLMMIAGVIFSVTPVFAGTGKGCIIKYVHYDDAPVEGAYVEVWGSDQTKSAPGGYTGADGSINFCELEYGTYYLYVDWDDDGNWDTIGEEVVLDQDIVEIYNYYHPPEVPARTILKNNVE